MKIYKPALQGLGLLLVLLLMLSGCNFWEHGHEAASEDAAESVAVTAYSARSELFMEYDVPVAGEKAGFLVHLTRLGDFKPVTVGSLKLVFIPASGVPVTFAVDTPARPGIYKTDVTLNSPGAYTLKLITDGEGFADEITVPDVKVLAKGEQPTGHADGGGAISYLKEQQWVVDFMVEQPAKKDLGSFVTAMGELVPVASAEATVSAPLAGTVSTAALPFIGKKVARGEVVALIDPPVWSSGGMGQMNAAYVEAKGRVSLAEKEYERAKKLHEAKIAPLKRVEEAELALVSARAAFEPLDRAMGSVNGEKGSRIAVRAPIGGTVAEVLTGAGKGVEAGQPILRIVDTGTLWLKANIPATGIGIVEQGLAVTFTVPGLTETFETARLVSAGDMLDPQTRTLPVLLEVPNPSGRLKAGLFATAALRTGTVASALAVPKEALIEDEGRWFVFVQASGEAFDRREVKTGVEDGGYVQITAGLHGDERIVTRGAYYVKQAESAAKGGNDHGHGH
ncbi:MAG: efflux RND transporter periplasmic adaptor subunit [Deltaproteobacteria bacterium]|nr:MAG: efflux RND transporter periplasmic adaptor subunit [Deltaproteobacteria bacterium]